MKANEVIYCEDCGKYFDTEEEKEEHKSTNHSGSQSKLFEQVTPIFSDHQDITLDDKVNFSLPPPRGEFDYQEGKTCRIKKTIKGFELMNIDYVEIIYTKTFPALFNREPDLFT